MADVFCFKYLSWRILTATCGAHPLFGRFLFGVNLSPRNSANDREDPRDCNPMFKRLPAEVVRESKCCFFYRCSIFNMKSFARKTVAEREGLGIVQMRKKHLVMHMCSHRPQELMKWTYQNWRATRVGSSSTIALKEAALRTNDLL